jgi:hypothetical protein
VAVMAPRARWPTGQSTPLLTPSAGLVVASDARGNRPSPERAGEAVARRHASSSAGVVAEVSASRRVPPRCGGQSSGGVVRHEAGRGFRGPQAVGGTDRSASSSRRDPRAGSGYGRSLGSADAAQSSAQLFHRGPSRAVSMVRLGAERGLATSLMIVRVGRCRRAWGRQTWIRWSDA